MDIWFYADQKKEKRLVYSPSGFVLCAIDIFCQMVKSIFQDGGIWDEH